jgi:hypothetical protein
VVAGASISPAITVRAEDSFGTLDTTYTGTVTAAIGTNPGSGTLSGTLAVAASGGVATFSNLSINKVGVGYTLTFTGSLTTDTSTTFNVTADRYDYGQEPTNTAANSLITPAITVRAEDSSGGLDTTYTGNVTLAIGTNPSGGTLNGTLVRAAVAGVATFSNNNINLAGVGYTLVASGSLTSDTSSAFDITALTGQPSKIVSMGLRLGYHRPPSMKGA